MWTWNAPHGLPDLNEGELHVWRGDLDRSRPALRALEQTLGPEEVEKARQFRLERDRNQYVLAHGILRTILARYLKSRPDEPEFRYGPNGKPELATSAVQFNMSHSQHVVICVISRMRHVGVDVEWVRPWIDEEVAVCLSPRARRFLAALPQPARQRVFFQGWTRMEAYSKARGVGLRLGLETFDAFLGLSNPVRLGDLGDVGQASGWWVYAFSPRRGYLAALAAARGKCRLSYWRWHPRRQLEAFHRSEVELDRDFNSVGVSTD